MIDDDAFKNESMALDAEALKIDLSQRTPGAIEALVMSINPRSPLDDLAAALDSSEMLLSRARTIDTLMKQIAVRWIERNGNFSIGDIQYSVGYASAVKCTNVPKTVHTLLEAVGGDIDALSNV